MSKCTAKFNFNISPFIVTSILSILILIFSFTYAFLDKNGKDLSENNIKKFFHKRVFNFYNHCSERQIEIIGGSINALGSPDSLNSDLILQSVHFENNHFGVNIIGVKSGRFLCFNRKSKLIIRWSGTSPRCMFEEIFSSDRMFSIIRSVYNPKWCVGFNSKGKAMLGSDYNKKSKCFLFTKRKHNYLTLDHKSPRMISHPNKLLHLLKDKKSRKRKTHR